jgi:hypothetical protein
MKLSSFTMDTFREGRSLLTSAWTPPWRGDAAAIGVIVAARLPSRVAILCELTPSADLGRTRSWLAGWLKAWLFSANHAQRQQDASFFYLILRRLPHDDDAFGISAESPVAEFGFGTAPRAPAEWKDEPLESLFAYVVNAFACESGTP